MRSGRANKGRNKVSRAAGAACALDKDAGPGRVRHCHSLQSPVSLRLGNIQESGRIDARRV